MSLLKLTKEKPWKVKTKKLEKNLTGVTKRGLDNSNWYPLRYSEMLLSEFWELIFTLEISAHLYENPSARKQKDFRAETNAWYTWSLIFRWRWYLTQRVRFSVCSICTPKNEDKLQWK